MEGGGKRTELDTETAPDAVADADDAEYDGDESGDGGGSGTAFIEI